MASKLTRPAAGGRGWDAAAEEEGANSVDAGIGEGGDEGKGEGGGQDGGAGPGGGGGTGVPRA